MNTPDFNDPDHEFYDPETEWPTSHFLIVMGVLFVLVVLAIKGLISLF